MVYIISEETKMLKIQEKFSTCWDEMHLNCHLEEYNHSFDNIIRGGIDSYAGQTVTNKMRHNYFS